MLGMCNCNLYLWHVLLSIRIARFSHRNKFQNITDLTQRICVSRSDVYRRSKQLSQDSWVLFAHPQEFPLLLCEETSGPESCLPSIKCFHLDSVSVPSGGKMTMSKFKKVQKYKSLVFLETKENRTLWSIDMPNSTYLVIFFIPLLLWGRFIIIL